MSSRPPAKPKVLKFIDSKAQLPARIIKSAHDTFLPYFCFIGHNNKRALSRFVLSGQLFNGANLWLPDPPPPLPSAIR